MIKTTKRDAKAQYVAAYMPPERKALLKRLARRRRRTVSDILNELVAAAVAPLASEGSAQGEAEQHA